MSDVDGCFICSEPISVVALTPCHHSTCATCCTRLRGLYKQTKCTFCNQELPSIVCTSDLQSTFEDYALDQEIPGRTHLTLHDKKLGFWFTDLEVMDDTLGLLRFNCPDPNCDKAFNSWRDIKQHVRVVHDRVVCELCLQNLKIFAHEHVLHTKESLKAHTEKGDGTETGFAGHPTCHFCKLTLFDGDALFKHCRERHEQCFICIGNGRGDRHQYYRNYNELERHFDRDHFSCLDPGCREKKFVVFETAFEMQKHEVEEHGISGLNKRAMKQARRLETNFTYSNEASTSRPATHRREHPPSQPASASQSQSASARPSPAPSPAPVDAAPRGRTVPGALPPSEASGKKAKGKSKFQGNLTPLTPATPSTPAEPVASTSAALNTDTLNRHAEVMRLVSDAVQNNPNKVLGFKAAVRAFRQSETTVQNLLDTLYQLFDRKLEVLGSILLETADLMDKLDKRKEILEAWLDFKGDDEDAFPSLAPLTVAPRTAPTPSALPSRHTRASQRNPEIWARVQQAATRAPARSIPGLPSRSTEQAFPALAKGTPQKSNSVKTAWSASAHTSTATKPIIVQSVAAAPSRPATRAPTRPPASKAEFPELPASQAAAARAAARERFKLPTRQVSPVPGGWGARDDPDPVEEAAPEVEPKGKGKKKPKKQLLFAFPA